MDVHEALEGVADVLEVAHVAACADDSVRADGHETLDVLEACQRTIRGFTRRLSPESIDDKALY